MTAQIPMPTPQFRDWSERRQIENNAVRLERALFDGTSYGETTLWAPVGRISGADYMAYIEVRSDRWEMSSSGIVSLCGFSTWGDAREHLVSLIEHMEIEHYTIDLREQFRCI